MAKFLFMLSKEDWQGLSPRKIDELGKRTDLSDDQSKLLEVFRIVDLRVEWLCNRLVSLNNIVVGMAGVMLFTLALLLLKPNAAKFLLSLLPSP